MVDFRYHLISIIAVLLALAIGILAGTGFLGGPLLRDLQNRAKSLARRNDDLEKSLDADRQQVSSFEDFVTAAGPRLLGDTLRDRTVVMLVYEGTPDPVVAGVEREVTAAGATISSTIRILDKFALDNPPDRDQIALIVHSPSNKAAALRTQAATAMANRAATVASIAPESIPRSATATRKLIALLGELQRAGFLNVSPDVTSQTVPSGASFLVLGGGAADPPYDAAAFGKALATGLSSGRSPVEVVSPSDSVWGLVGALRQDPEARSAVATVDNADTSIGQLAAALGLAAAIKGDVEQLGTGDGADAIIPAPIPTPTG